MFEHVGKPIDDDAAARSAKSAGLTLGLLALLGGVGFAWATWKAAEVVVKAIIQDEAMVEVVLDEPDLTEALPPPPPPPPPSVAAAVEPEDPDTDVDAQPEPDEMLDEVPTLDEDPDTDIREADRPKGEEGGVEGGQEGGDAKYGVLGGVEGGVPGGQLGASRTVHRNDVQVKRCLPSVFKYPEAAENLSLGTQSCIASVHLDAEGVPVAVDVQSTCPKVFHNATREGLLQCRWYPYKSGGQKIPVQFQFKVTFVPPR